MKKLVALILSLMMLGLAGCALAEGEVTIGSLSYLNMTETEDARILNNMMAMLQVLRIHGVLVETESAHEEGNAVTHVMHYYDSLDAMLMGLQAGEVKDIRVPYYTGLYLSATNDGLKLRREYHPEKANAVSQTMIDVLSDGYSFMLKEDNAALRDELDAQITAMKEDGTLQKLIDEYIIKAAETGEAVAVTFDSFEGDPIRIAVTGSLPPMDYVAADGSFAGFNTAVLAEIGRRLQKNIELVQVDSIGRALAISQGTVDVVFWTRGSSEGLPQNISEENVSTMEAEMQEMMTDEEKAIMDTAEKPDADKVQKIVNRDMPEGTIITQPYFTDFPVMVSMK